MLGSYALIVTRTKAAVEEATARLTAILEKDPDCVPALLALATAAMVQKSIPKARNLVKRLLKLPFDRCVRPDARPPPCPARGFTPPFLCAAS